MKPAAPITESQLAELTDAALGVAANAYAPYSGFRVGAALLFTLPDSHDEITVTGCNVENASYGLTNCAERSAIAQAVARFGPAARFRAAVVVNLNNSPSSPCGACRQVLHEFALPAAQIFFPAQTLPGGPLHTERQSISALLPFGFRLE